MINNWYSIGAYHHADGPVAGNRFHYEEPKKTYCPPEFEQYYFDKRDPRQKTYLWEEVYINTEEDYKQLRISKRLAVLKFEKENNVTGAKIIETSEGRWGTYFIFVKTKVIEL